MGRGRGRPPGRGRGGRTAPPAAPWGDPAARSAFMLPAAPMEPSTSDVGFLGMGPRDEEEGEEEEEEEEEAASIGGVVDDMEEEVMDGNIRVSAQMYP